MTREVQLCAHLRRHGTGERTVTAHNLSVELCKRCVRELDARLAEKRHPLTPIEQLAAKSEVLLQQGCIYEIRKFPTSYCRAVCDPNRVMCPRHLALTAASAERELLHG